MNRTVQESLPFAALALAGMLLACDSAMALPSPKPSASTSPSKRAAHHPEDNTAANKLDSDLPGDQDRASMKRRPPTADQQPLSDTQTVSRIRSAIVEDSSLSTYAHNVKIVSRGNRVTLRGPVRSAEEKRRVTELAAHVAGQENVEDMLTVTPKQK